MRKYVIANGLSLLLAILVSTAGIAFISPDKAEAVTGSEFQAGRIIDDGTFFASSEMNVAQIQEFLNAKVPSCDTNGTQPYAGTTAGAYGTSRGYPPPYTCLKDYRQNTTAKSAESGLCNGYPAANHSAADIIYSVAQSCGINPKVLIVLLQKEQGLVTDSWPWSLQYRSATGYGCPDTAPCDSQYYGFFNQVYNAARQFKNYIINSSSFNYRAYRNNTILYNPSASCGGSSIYIQNPATAALYNYTPYQPNQAALNNLYGSGDSCSAYGNRNFWRYYNDWFGSTQRFNANISLSESLSTTAPGGIAQVGETITATYKVTNTADYGTPAGGLGICGRINGEFYDFGFSDQTVIAAKSTATVSYSKKLDRSGVISLFICSYHASIGGWASPTYPYNSVAANVRTASVQVYDNPLITSGITFSPANPSMGQPVTATMTLRNASSSPVDVGLVTIAARDPWNNNFDFPAETNLTIAPNTTYTYSKTRIFTNPGNHSFFVASLRSNSWSTSYPKSASGAIRSGTLNVRDNPLITSNVSFSPASPGAGQPVTANISIHNTSASSVTLPMFLIAARSPSGSNVDFPADTNLTIPANTTYTYSKTRTLNQPGTHSFFTVSYNGSTWDTNYPKSADSGLLRKGFMGVQENPLVTSGVSFSPTNPTAGQSVTATMTIRNASASPVSINLLVLAARDKNGSNVDFPADTNLTIPANTTYTYSKTRVLPTSGSHTFFIASFHNNTWDTNYPRSLDGSIIRRGSLSVQ
jgi:hypothetical protein